MTYVNFFKIFSDQTGKVNALDRFQFLIYYLLLLCFRESVFLNILFSIRFIIYGPHSYKIYDEKTENYKNYDNNIGKYLGALFFIRN